MTWFVIILIILAFSLLVYSVQLRTKLRTAQQEEIQKSEARRSAFVSIISHQLRTPLSIIRGYLESLVAGDLGKLNQRQTEYLDEATKINHDTIAMVNDYLNTVKLDSENMEVHPQAVDLVKLVSDEVSRLMPLARASNCEIVFKKPTQKIPFVSADFVKIQQVIENILNNAIKYTKRSGRAVLTVREDEQGVLFSCADNGVGIPADQQAEIFTKFFRAKNVINKNTKGSGLGLYLAKMIVDALGGKIWLESKENVGTTIYFRLPKRGSA